MPNVDAFIFISQSIREPNELQKSCMDKIRMKVLHHRALNIITISWFLLDSTWIRVNSDGAA